MIVAADRSVAKGIIPVYTQKDTIYSMMMETRMESQPMYQEIKRELEGAIAQAYALSTEGEREDFLARATLNLGEKLKAGLLTRTEHLALNLKLGLYAKEHLTTPISDRLDDLSMESWDLH